MTFGGPLRKEPVREWESSRGKFILVQFFRSFSVNSRSYSLKRIGESVQNELFAAGSPFSDRLLGSALSADKSRAKNAKANYPISYLCCQCQESIGVFNTLQAIKPRCQKSEATSCMYLIDFKSPLALEAAKY